MRAKALPIYGPLLAALMLLAATGPPRALDYPTRAPSRSMRSRIRRPTATRW